MRGADSHAKRINARLIEMSKREIREQKTRQCEIHVDFECARGDGDDSSDSFAATADSDDNRSG